MRQPTVGPNNFNPSPLLLVFLSSFRRIRLIDPTDSILYSVKLTIGQNSPRITLARKVRVFVLVSREAKLPNFKRFLFAARSG
jgi:hypothetical protein